MFARLRIASAVVATGARLATDLLGYALVGSVSHRLDDVLDFKDSSLLLFLQANLAWSHAEFPVRAPIAGSVGSQTTEPLGSIWLIAEPAGQLSMINAW